MTRSVTGILGCGFSAIFGLAFLVIGILQLGYCILESTRALMATRWPTTQGQVQESYVQIKKPPEIRGTAYVAVVKYSYSVGGARFAGSRIHWSDEAEFLDSAQATTEAFRIGSQVPVWFNPDDPSQALLRPGLYWFSGMWFVIACVAVGVGGLLVRHGYRLGTQPNAA